MLDIGEVVAQSGVPASALRFYEAKGLIRSVGRRGLRRLFAPEVLERLALIGLGQSAGLTLDEIGRMFCTDGRIKVDRNLLARKAEALDASVRQLIAMRNGLRHAARCPARDHLECPTFRRLVGLQRRLAPSKRRP